VPQQQVLYDQITVLPAERTYDREDAQDEIKHPVASPIQERHVADRVLPSHRKADWVYPAVEANDAMQAEIEALLHVLENGGTHPLDRRSARAEDEIMMAVFESARRRARIDLPLREQAYLLDALVAEGEREPSGHHPLRGAGVSP